MAPVSFHIETFSLYRNQSFFQTWTKWINILVNKYISDMSLYWNVLLYIKYNTISFLFLLFSFCTQSIQNILTHPLKFWRDFFCYSIRKGSFSSLFLKNMKNKHINNTKTKILNRMKSHQIFCSIAKSFFFHVLMVSGLLYINTMSFMLFFILYKNLLKPKCCL